MALDKLLTPMPISTVLKKAVSVENIVYTEAYLAYLLGLLTDRHRRILREGPAKFWFPKSQSKVERGMLIACEPWLARKYGIKTESMQEIVPLTPEQIDENRRIAELRYHAMVRKAKLAGVKNVRLGITTNLLRKKMVKAGLSPSVSDEELAAVQFLLDRRKKGEALDITADPYASEQAQAQDMQVQAEEDWDEVASTEAAPVPLHLLRPRF